LQRFERRRDLQVRALAGVLRHQTGIEGMRRELDERIGLPMLEAPFVARTHRLREGLESGAHGRSTDWVQLAADEKRPIFPDGELEPALLNRDSLLPGYAFRIERMA
jgi:hypothetical protein